MHKLFFEVFPTLKLRQEMQCLLADVEVTKVSSNQAKDRLRIHLQSDRLIPKSNIYKLEDIIKDQLFHRSPLQVKIIEQFRGLERQYSPKTLFESYHDSIMEEIKEYCLIQYNLLRCGKMEFSGENELQLILEDSLVAIEKSNEIMRVLEKIICERCGLNLQLRIDFEKAETNKKRKDEVLFEMQSPKIPANTLADEAPAKHKMSSPEKNGANPSFRNKKPSSPDVVFGRDFTGEPIPLEQLAQEQGEVVIRGKVLKLETRDIRDEKKLLIFDLTDFTDSIRVKMFLKKEKFEEISQEVKEGAFLSIKGIALIDSFDKELGIGSVSGIKKIQDFAGRRQDLSPRKRVELHCHTKMSDMDGVADIKGLIQCAISWGHKALAITDHGVVQAFPEASQALPKDVDFKLIYGMEAYLVDDIKHPNWRKNKKMPFHHAIVLAANDLGRMNLYRLVSESHLNHYHRRPRIPKSELMKCREGLILGSACEAGELYRALLLEKPEEEIVELVNFYDYLEIQPAENNAFLLRGDKSRFSTVEELRDMNRKIVALGEEYDKPVVATCDVHFLTPEDEVYRRIIMTGKGFKDADQQAPLYLHTTEEMLEEFTYLGKEKAEEVVIANSNMIADMCENIQPVRPDRCPPVIEHADRDLRDLCYAKAHELYGTPLPPMVVERLERELNSIISNGFAVMYVIAEKLVSKSNQDGYLVGSRGSVGSSFVATMAGITEVNPLPAHYYCGDCHFSDFDSVLVMPYRGQAGCDMPNRDCPDCGQALRKEGFHIPFETFMGFEGNKEPDIDLNFSGEYQSLAHKYTETIFGSGQTFRAGTIGTLADKTAFGFVKKYYEEKGLPKRSCEIDRMIKGCVGVRKTTGQHPGGIIVLPVGEEIYSFTPVQHPANDLSTDTITTHFDYHSIDHNLLKLDILGHDDPTMIRMLEDMTGVDAQTIMLDDPVVMSLFRSPKALGIGPEDIGGCQLGVMGIPEFGTDFVLQMLLDTKPRTFSDLVRISGLSHGTDVWIGNAQTLIQEGKATLSTAICTRDDIMTYLINKGVESKTAFTITESVRKGRGLKPEWEDVMRLVGVPDWYIGSCKKISYMFPKAHAAAYVMMAWRIAWFKVFHPLAYYAAFFSIRASAFQYELMCQGKDRLELNLSDFEKGKDGLTKKEQDTLKDMKIVQEMYARGFEFLPLDLYRAKAREFQLIDGKLMPSLNTIDGLGDKAADAVVEAVKDGRFLSRDDFAQRTKVSKAVIEMMAEFGILGDLPKSNQMSLFD